MCALLLCTIDFIVTLLLTVICIRLLSLAVGLMYVKDIWLFHDHNGNKLVQISTFLVLIAHIWSGEADSLTQGLIASKIV